MKISIGSNIVEGPWGGGNQFANSLSEHLKKRGWEVLCNLDDDNIDIILMTEPRITSRSSAYNQKHISKYLLRNPNTIVVHRINECDERKGTRGVNKNLMRANKVADHTVFISDFLRKLFIDKRFFTKIDSSSVVRNGADKKIFNDMGLEKWDHRSPLKLVTHHWGFNYNKGFDIYKMLGGINSIGKIKIEFNYIGKIPEKEKINFKITSPLSGKKLAEELKANHIYVSGSINEPGGMHHIEGAMCGLPLLFRNSGALPEHCTGFGEMFEDTRDFENKLKTIIKKYDYYSKKIADYPYDSDLMCNRYEELFLCLIKKDIHLSILGRRLFYFVLYLKESILHLRDTFLIKIKRIIEIIRYGKEE